MVTDSIPLSERDWQDDERETIDISVPEWVDTRFWATGKRNGKRVGTNIRSGAGEQYRSVGVIPVSGLEGKLKLSTRYQAWVQLQNGAVEGWACKKFIGMDVQSIAPPEPPPTDEPTYPMDMTPVPPSTVMATKQERQIIVDLIGNLATNPLLSTHYLKFDPARISAFLYWLMHYLEHMETGEEDE